MRPLLRWYTRGWLTLISTAAAWHTADILLRRYEASRNMKLQMGCQPAVDALLKVLYGPVPE